MKALHLNIPANAKFHLGEYTEDQNTALANTATLIHSDVLFGAFISALANINPEKLETFKTYFSQGNIQISSAFYVMKINEKQVYLLPKPVSLNLYQPKDIEHFQVKKFKKIEYISKGVWEQGISPEFWFDGEICAMPNSRTICLKSEIGDQKFELYTLHQEEKVVINNDDDNEPYFINSLCILGNDRAKVDFYFLAHTENIAQEDEILFYKIWKWVALNRIGGERSTGYGAIDSISIDDNFEIKNDISSEKMVLMGLAFPDTLEHYHYYQTKVRGGMNYGENKKIPLITAVQEGAVIHKGEKSRIIDMSQNHKKYWKYSSSLALPLHQHYDL